MPQHAPTAATALLISNNISAKSDGGVRQMLAIHFKKKGLTDKSHGDFYTDIFYKRPMGDYYVDFILFEAANVLPAVIAGQAMSSSN